MIRSRILKIIFLLLLAVLPALLCTGAAAEETPALTGVTAAGEHAFACVYNGAERKFSVYAPAEAPKGILFMLHGYGSAGEDFRLLTGMEKTANGRGYVAVFPTGATTPEDPTSANGWNSGIGISSSDDIGFLCALARHLQAEYGLTRENTFAAGFSNGGFMMYRIALEGQDTFAGVAGVAAMMPEAMWKARPETARISVLQINGTKDDAVPMKLNGSDRYTRAPAIEDVTDYFARANGLREQSTENIAPQAVLMKYASAEKKEQVWRVLITDGRHSWPEEKYCGFSVNALILDFFDRV